MMTLLSVFISLSISFNAVSFQDFKAISHELFDRALKQHVQNGLVDYPAMAKDENFLQYLTWLKTANPENFENRQEQLAFWINAYNALAIKGVVDHYPLEKVINIDGFFDKIQYPVAGGSYTLDQIEKQIIFKKLNDPRLHFVLVCAAKSCPALPSEAYTGKTVLVKMDEVGRAFLNNPQKNYLDREEKILSLSQIFNWYQKDFTSEGNTLVDFVKPFFSEAMQKFLSANQVEIRFLEYDWQLNEKDRN
jgi:hypothetical protein